MKYRHERARRLAALAPALALGLALAAPITDAAEPVPPTGGAGPMAGMAHGGGTGMRCHMRGHKRMGQAIPMPRLPPGNEKLQLQMEAEILQKIGEIQGKYAAQLP